MAVVELESLTWMDRIGRLRRGCWVLGVGDKQLVFNPAPNTLFLSRPAGEDETSARRFFSEA
jgi:hypothetical protein